MLKDFNLCIDTKFVFGKDAQNQIGSELKQMGIRKVLIHHDDGKFLYDTGLLDQVKDSLKRKESKRWNLAGSCRIQDCLL